MQLWFTKRRRAQSPDDFETWIEGGVSPTLNAFDNTGDSRATILVLAYDPGVIGPLTATGMTRARGTESVESHHVLCFTAQRVGEPPRIYENITPSLLSRMGTGGNNTPMVVVPEELPIAFDSNASGAYTIHADGMSPPIKVGSGIDIPSPPAVAVNFDELNNTGGDTVHHTLRNTGGVSSGVYHNTVVRRLTPLECERLMGWPDNHTLHRADGKTNSDSTRYKMCGNGVATPVAEWIATQLKELL